MSEPATFCWEDVRRHRSCAQKAREGMEQEPRWVDDHRADAEWHESMAERIASLLPPEEP